MSSGNSPHGRRQGLNDAMQNLLSSMDERAQNIAMVGRDENGNITSKSASRGGGMTNEEVANMAYDQLKQTQQWEHDEDWYSAHDSYSAKVSEMQAAGLNPAMMYGGSMQTSSSSSDAASGSVSDGTAPDSDASGLSGALGVIGQLLGIGSQINNTIVSQKNAESQRIVAESQANKNNADADRARQDYDWNSETWSVRQDILNFEKRSREAGIDLTHQEIEESKARIRQADERINIDWFVSTAGYYETIQSIEQKWQELRIEQQNANTNEQNAISGRIVAEADVELKGAQAMQAYESVQAIIKDNKNRDFVNTLNDFKKASGIMDDTVALMCMNYYEMRQYDAANKLAAVYKKMVQNKAFYDTTAGKFTQKGIDFLFDSLGKGVDTALFGVKTSMLPKK